MKKANDSVIVDSHGHPTLVKKYQEFEDDDPIVRAYPWLFTTDTVERATAAPGERRNVRVPKR